MFNVRSWYFSLSALGFALLFYYSPSLQDSAVEGIPRSIYDITVKDVSENEVSLGSYRGKVLLIVNVASKWFKQFMAIKLVLMDKDIALFNPCLGASESYNFLNHYEFYHRTDIALFISGFTHSNYKEMNVLYDKYKDKGLEILAFPCNQFGGQEPGSNEQIQEFTCSRFKSEFPIFDKIEVNGNKAAPLYKFLKSQKGGFLGSQIKWNFTKFLVDKNGNVVGRYAPVTSPLKIEGDIQRLLDA